MVGVACGCGSPEVLQATPLLLLPSTSLSAQQPHPNMAAWPTLPGDLRDIPPLETPAAVPPPISRHMAPTVSRGARQGWEELGAGPTSRGRQ